MIHFSLNKNLMMLQSISRYAETSDDNIKFRLKKGKKGSSGGYSSGKLELELLDTPFMSKPAAQSGLLVLKLNHSWPVFLANITQALMEDVTVL